MWQRKLNEEQKQELAQWRADPTLKPAERDRVEMVALADAGWEVKAIAPHLGYHPESVRRVFRRWRRDGWQVVRHQPPGPAPDQARRDQVETALTGLLQQERTWTSRQLADALTSQQINLSGRQVRRYLQAVRAGYRRTYRSLKHKQDPAKVIQAQTELDLFVNRRKQAS